MMSRIRLSFFAPRETASRRTPGPCGRDAFKGRALGSSRYRSVVSAHKDARCVERKGARAAEGGAGMRLREGVPNHK